MPAPLRVFDSHFHVWDLDKQNLPWLTSTDGSISQTFTVDQLRREFSAYDAELVGSVYVEVDSDNPVLILK